MAVARRLNGQIQVALVTSPKRRLGFPSNDRGTESKAELQRPPGDIPQIQTLGGEDSYASKNVAGAWIVHPCFALGTGTG